MIPEQKLIIVIVNTENYKKYILYYLSMIMINGFFVSIRIDSLSVVTNQSVKLENKSKNDYKLLFKYIYEYI